MEAVLVLLAAVAAVCRKQRMQVAAVGVLVQG
jgi:hypothetical protein